VLQKTRALGKPSRRRFRSIVHNLARSARFPEDVTPGSPASRKRASVPGRGAGTKQLFRPWSSFACENRASWNGDDG
jgi:hypothetical protein